MTAKKRLYLLLHVGSLEGHGVGNDSEPNEVLIRDKFTGVERAPARSQSADVQIDVKSRLKGAKIIRRARWWK
jgi:hypothetical protein